MFQLSDHVRANYIQTRYFAQEDIWKLLHPKHFVNVMLIHHMERRGEKEILDIASIMREGLLHEASKFPSTSSTKLQSEQCGFSVSTNNISDIFEPFKRKDSSTVIPNVILIDGAPGMGKTTLCKEIAYRWAECLLLNNIKLLFFIYLRDPDIIKIQNLENFIHYFYNFDKAAAEFSRQCADALINRKNDDIAIVLDGYDEYSDATGKLFLTHVLNRKAFSQCRLIVTSRPIATDRLQSKADIRVEVMGFNDASKKEYIKQELDNSPDKIEKLCSYLEKNKDINSICYIPMIMTILVFTFKEIQELPANQIELYNKFVTVAVSRYVQKLEEIPNTDILPLQKLPEIYKTYLLELSKFAFETLKSDKIVFTETDVQQLCPNLALGKNNFQGLGLLKSTQYFSMKKVDNCISYNFLHLSIQEFLAAYYICSHKPCMQFSLLKNTFYLKKYLNVWIMHGNLNKHVMSQLYNYYVQCNAICFSKSLYSKIQYLNVVDSFGELIRNCVNCDSCNTCQMYCYKNLSTEPYADTKSLQYLDKICLLNKLSPETTCNKIYLSLYHVAQNDKQLMETFVIDTNIQENLYCTIASKLYENKNLSVMIINTSSLLAYRANKEQFRNSFNMNDFINKLILKDCFISDETSVLLSSFIEKSKLIIAIIVNCTFSEAGSKIVFSSLGYINTVSIMAITNIDINGDTATAVANTIVNNTSLIHVEISSCYMQLEAAMKIVTALKNIPNLKNLILSNNNISKYVSDDLAVAICINSNLEVLNLSNNNLQDHTVVVAHALTQVKKLTHLDLSNNNMSNNVVDALALAIELNTSLKMINIKGNSLTTVGMTKIAQSLCWSSHLSKLNISNNQITEQACDAIAIALLSNVNIEELYLSNNDLGAGIVKIAIALQNVSTLTVLDLNNNKGTEKVSDHLGVVIENNKLEKLFLVNNKLKLSTIIIATALSKITTLTELDLSNNGITKEVACSLAAAFESNNSVTILRLSKNKLQTLGIKTISMSLRKLSSLQVLDMDDNEITEEAADDIAFIIVRNKYLRELNLNDNNIKDGIIKIADALKNTPGLKKLLLNSNNISTKVAYALADALKNLKLLSVFGIMYNDLRTKGIVTIAKSLCYISGLTFLNIHNNNITTEAEDAIAQVIQNNKRLEELYLSENDFPRGVKIIASLTEVYTLKILNIRNCRMLNDDVGEDLGIALSNKHLLKTIALESNYLKTDGIIAMSKSLRCTSSIKILNLHNNMLTEEAGESVASIILCNAQLEELYIGSNKLQAGASKILLALTHISTLKVLDLNDNNITEFVADALANAIDCNPLLSKLRLRSNKLKTRGIAKISKSLSKMSSLKELNLRNNQITEEASGALVSILLSNTAIEELYLGCNYFTRGIVKIVTALRSNSNLKLLDLDDNKIFEMADNELMLSLHRNALENLSLAKNNLHSLKNVIYQDLQSSMQLTELNFNDNYLSGKMAQEYVTDIICNNSSLNCVLLQNNCFKMQELFEILQSISKLSTLTTLNIKGNMVTSELADIIALVIRNNSGLEKIHMNCDDLQQDVLKITKALKSTSKLKVLELRGGNVFKKLAYDLANIIESNHMHTLQLTDNNLKLSASIIAQAISGITSLSVLNLSSNYISEECANDLAIAITNNQSLKELKLVGNQLRLNGMIVILEALSKLSKLKALNIRRNFIISSQELVDAIAETLSNNKEVETLCLGDNDCSNHSIAIVSALSNLSTLNLLYLSGMQLLNDITVANGLINIIKNNCLLEYLYLADNCLSSSLISITNTCKEYSKNLKMLDLRNNSLHYSNVIDVAINTNGICSLEAALLGGLTLNNNEAIFHHLVTNMKSEDFDFSVCDQAKILEYLALGAQNNEICTHIKHSFKQTSITLYSVKCFYINIWNMLQTSVDKSFLTNLTKKQQKRSEIDATSITYFLTILRNMDVIDLELLNIDENAAFELAASIQYNNKLKQLWLRGNRLNSAGALFIFNSLEHISTLTALDLSNNNIGCQLSDSIAAVVSSNSGLEQLWLDGNPLLSKGIIKISTALKCLSTLRTLSLCNNGIADDAADEISIVIANNNYLEDIQLSSNHFQSGISVIAESFNKLLRLRKLDLFNNRISNDSADKLADTISNCCNLQELYLSNNMLKTVGTIKILKALKCKCKLEILTLSNNNITEEVASYLTDVLINNNKFYILLIGGNNLQTTATLKIANVVKNHNTGMQLLAVCDNNISARGKNEINKIFSTMQLKVYV